MSQFEYFIYEDIGTPGISAKTFELDIKTLRAGAGDIINLRINSGGGSVFDGIGIYNALRRHPSKIIVSIDGLAASAASLIAMAGDTIEISASAYLMIHNPWIGGASGGANDLRKAAEDLDRLTQTFLAAYVARAKGRLSAERCKELMDAETWLNAQEAVSFGLADQVTEPLDMAACVSLTKFGYSNVPDFAESAEPGSIRARLRRMQLIVARNEAMQRGQRAAAEYREQLRRDRLATQTQSVEDMLIARRMLPDGCLLPDGVSWDTEPWTPERHKKLVQQLFENRH